MQRLWRSSPTLANLDGLVEYGGDYTQIGTAKQVVRTAYQVGRGMLQRLDALPAGEEGARPAAGVARAEPAQPPVTLAPAEPAAAAAPERSGAGSTDAAIAGPAESSDAGPPAPEAKPAQAATQAAAAAATRLNRALFCGFLDRDAQPPCTYGSWMLRHMPDPLASASAGE